MHTVAQIGVVILMRGAQHLVPASIWVQTLSHMELQKVNLGSKTSAEAEYRGLANATAELLWIQSFLNELKIKYQSLVLMCEHNPVLHSRTKYLELDIHCEGTSFVQGFENCSCTSNSAYS